MPFEVGPFPEEVPDVAGADEPHFADGYLDLLAGTLERGANEEEFDAGAVEPLPFAHLVAQVQRGTAARPELFFEGRGVFACRGTRWMKPRRSSVSTMECTLGGVIWKNRCMSASAGVQAFTRVYWWM